MWMVFKESNMSSVTKSKTIPPRAARKTPARQSAKKKSNSLRPELREQMIAESAYYRAQGRGFMVGDDMQDWLAAEDETDRLLLNQI